MQTHSQVADDALIFPLSARRDFCALPSDPSLVTDEQRQIAFPGLATACKHLALQFARKEYSTPADVTVSA